MAPLSPAGEAPEVDGESAPRAPPPLSLRRELRRSSDPFRAQQLWDAIQAVRAQKQIPAITRMARYMNRFYQVKKDETQRLLDAAVEDNLIKLERKIGTKGTKSGVEEKAYRLPSLDMLPRERHDWYCFHCHAGGQVMLCGNCHRVVHRECLKHLFRASVLRPVVTAVHEGAGDDDDDEDDDEDEAASQADARNEWICRICQTLQNVPESFNKRERRDLNHLLRLLCQKLREKLPPTGLLSREIPLPPSGSGGGATAAAATPGGVAMATTANANADRTAVQSLNESQSEDGIKKTRQEEAWRATFLLKEQIDLKEMEQRCASYQYRIVDEFRADAQLIVHNIVIYHGVHSHMADLARQMFRDCCTDLKELLQCRDCYRYRYANANEERREKYWFCKPCRPFHDLVYAKQKGFPYWPAKVISSKSHQQNTSNARKGSRGGDKKSNILEVRFFGGYHQKAIVERNHIKPITTNIHTLQVKRTSLWNKACEELRKHQELLDKVKKNENFLKDPYGDPFSSDDMDVQFGDQNSDLGSAEEEDEEEEEEEDTGEQEGEDDVDGEEEKRPCPAAAAVHPSTSTGVVPVTPVDLPKHPVTLQVASQAEKKAKKKSKGKRLKKEDSEDQVSSSCQLESSRLFVNAGVQTQKLSTPTPTPTPVNNGGGGGGKKNARGGSDQGSSNSDTVQMIVEKMRAEFDQEKKRAVNVATRSLERDLERLKADHNTEIEEILDNHKAELLESKKKQWCYNCQAEAIYWCCWNTAYCSIECQQQHWHKEHKKSCRRKR